MSGPKGEMCGRCYYQSECDGKEWLYCHAKMERIDSLVAPDWWCREFRPHPDHACKACRGSGRAKDFRFTEKVDCKVCHGTGLRAEEAE